MYLFNPTDNVAEHLEKLARDMGAHDQNFANYLYDMARACERTSDVLNKSVPEAEVAENTDEAVFDMADRLADAINNELGDVDDAVDELALLEIDNTDTASIVPDVHAWAKNVVKSINDATKTLRDEADANEKTAGQFETEARDAQAALKESQRTADVPPVLRQRLRSARASLDAFKDEWERMIGPDPIDTAIAIAKNTADKGSK